MYVAKLNLFPYFYQIVSTPFNVICSISLSLQICFVLNRRLCSRHRNKRTNFKNFNKQKLLKITALSIEIENKNPVYRKKKNHKKIRTEIFYVA